MVTLAYLKRKENLTELHIIMVSVTRRILENVTDDGDMTRKNLIFM